MKGIGKFAFLFAGVGILHGCSVLDIPSDSELKAAFQQAHQDYLRESKKVANYAIGCPESSISAEVLEWETRHNLGWSLFSEKTIKSIGVKGCGKSSVLYLYCGNKEGEVSREYANYLLKLNKPANKCSINTSPVEQTTYKEGPREALGQRA